MTQKSLKLFCWVFLLILMTGCGYRIAAGPCSSMKTISVPYVQGDKDGALTSAIVRELCNSDCYLYVTNQGDLSLIVKIVDLRDENIGFRYYRKQRGKLTNSVIPTETRLWAKVEIALLDNDTGNYILGPALIETNADFDHDYYLNLHGINIFSLGQLSDVDSARDAVWEPLNKAISQKIVDYVSNSW
ncbi:putative uncharacterized protein [Parachlamydia acanthamoebae UV-7]|uniref:Lipoprotein n=3 Tax=Parachlamydiaceae TaxID=92713 RepID=F8KXI9_PARAV|nr:hypothetical protein DB43_GU00330 [Parachlamydia acanthamoebae]CCB87180.1 putative uncharacterized protein [Parachlamydia acanthamoebae UV-7]